MANRIAIKNRFEAWKTPLIVFSLMALMMSGFYFSERTTAQITVTNYVARLTGSPIGGLMPIGACGYAVAGGRSILWNSRRYSDYFKIEI